MTDDTEALVAPPPPDDSPAPAATLGPPAPAAPASDAPAPAATVEEAEPAAEAEGVQEPAPFAAFKEAEDLFEHPGVKAVHETGVRKAREDAYTELQGHMQPAIQANKQALDQISTATETIMTTLNRAAEDGALDKRVVEDLMRTHRGEFAALNQQHQTIGYWEGVKQYITGLLGNDAPTFTARLERMQQNVPDPTFTVDIQKKLQTQGHKDGYDEGYKKGLKEGKAAQATQQQVQGAPKGPNLIAGATAGGGPNLNQRRRDYHEGKTNEYPG